MSSQAILGFLSRRFCASRREDVVTALEEVIDGFGFSFYGLIRRPRPMEDPMGLLLAGRWPEGWPETYVRNKYVLVDPTIRYLGHAQRAFRWREAVPAFRGNSHEKRMARMMASAREHGLEDGYIFPVHGRQGLIGNLSVGGAVVDLDRSERALFDSVARIAFWRLMRIADPDAERELHEIRDVALTRREMEVLSHLAEGLTSHEISSALGISSNTVDWYMNGIQDKLQARNRHHAVSIAFRHGLVN